MQGLSELRAVNLDEVTNEVLDVAIREFKDGVRTTRIAHILNYVPMSVFHQMLASRGKALKDRSTWVSNGGTESGERDPLLTWMTQQVYAVWKLSEPTMPYIAFEEGLLFEQIQKLFTLFFSHLIQTIPAQNGATMTHESILT